MIKRLPAIIFILAAIISAFIFTQPKTVYLTIPADRYPEAAQHAHDAIAAGYPAKCTIQRGGSDKNRDMSLSTTPIKKGYDRDEFPMAMCKEGGKGASIRYMTPKDNRGAGAWVAYHSKGYDIIIFQN